MDDLSAKVKLYLTMAMALTMVKAGADLMLDVFKEHPDVPVPPNWPFPSMDEFVAEVVMCMDMYRMAAANQVVADGKKKDA